MEQFFSKMIVNDKLIEECGVFGIFNSKEAAVLTTLGLHALQHRGKEGAGIVTFDGKNFNGVRAQGLVSNTFNKKEIIGQLPGKNAVGHVDTLHKVNQLKKIFNHYLQTLLQVVLPVLTTEI